MEPTDSDKVPSGESEEVVKDSTIKVTVDDLQPGIIVVSFSHKKSLYQGVLLQLDRNRGIPCGISFPKSFIQDSHKPDDNGPKEIVSVEPSPLNKRLTYFQRDLINDPTSAIVDPNSKFPTLRRNIKPPARYKNSRMNLRVRNRPVLCAKCQILCEDKGPPPSNENVGDEEAAKKLLAGVSTRRNQGKSSKGDENSSNTTLALADSATTKLCADYKYCSYGQRGVVSNYWRRPNGIDDKGKSGCNSLSAAGSSKSQMNPEPKICIKPISLASLPKREMSAGTKMFGSENQAETTLDSNLHVWPSMPILSSSIDSSKMTSSAKKSKNLKLCISKLTMSKCDKTEPKIVTTLSKETERVTRSTAALNQENDIKQLNIKIKDCTPKNWNSRIRKRSTVPVRFRDESYLTKNIFKFKRRRVDEKPGELEKLPIYTSRIVSSDNDEVSNEDYNQVDESSEDTKNDLVCYSDTSGNSSVSSSSGGSQSTSNGHGDTKSEPAKTPVIKITFGSPGNGIVVQIPPKTTQEESSISPEAKAARKAMKKAKKEARRKVSMSRESSPSPKPNLSPPSLQENSPDSPLPPILNPEYPITPLNDESESLLCDRGPPPVEPMEPLRYIPKRRKKDKKKKRSKVSKENDLDSDHDVNAPESQRRLNSQDLPEPIRLFRLTEPRAPTLPALENEQGNECNKSRDIGTENNQTEAHQRLCLSLKRLDENMYCKIVTCEETFVNNNTEDNSNSSDISEVVPYDYPSSFFEDPSGLSLGTYWYQETDHTYKKGDIIWGKLPDCPWWPGKIQDIMCSGVEDVRAKISWYKSDVLSYIEFQCITPFAGTFDAMYTKSRNRGEYQEAVRDALLEAHEMSPKHISTE